MALPDEDPPRTESLVNSFQQGAEQAFAVLYERLAPALYAWAVLRVPKGIDATDLVGEVWLHAMRSLSRFDASRGAFRAWIFGIAKKVLLHELRELGRHNTLSPRRSDQISHELERVPESVTSLSVRLQRDEALLQFLDRVGRLEAEDRDLVIHCGLEGRTCGEAALRLGLSAEAATKRWQRLRADMQASGWAELFL